MYSRLDIINAMVISTGTRPLTAEQYNHPLYIKASTTLDRVVAAVLSIGLWFNTECRLVSKQTSGEIIVPQYCIKADPVDRNYDLTLRGNRMYNLSTGTYEIGKDVELKMQFELPLDEIPLAAKVYIQSKAVYEFYLDADGSDPKLSNYRNERDTGWQELYKEHLRSRQTNMFDNPSNTVARLRKGHTAYGSTSNLIKRR